MAMLFRRTALRNQASSTHPSPTSTLDSTSSRPPGSCRSNRGSSAQRAARRARAPRNAARPPKIAAASPAVRRPALRCRAHASRPVSGDWRMSAGWRGPSSSVDHALAAARRTGPAQATDAQRLSTGNPVAKCCSFVVDREHSLALVFTYLNL